MVARGATLETMSAATANGTVGYRPVLEISNTLTSDKVKQITLNLNGGKLGSVDKDLPREKRIADFVRQIKNPYHFKCGKFTVRVQYAEDGISLEDCLKGIIT